MSQFGQIAYEAYANRRGWATYNGDNMPIWDDQDAGLRTAWDAAAMAVIDSFDPVHLNLDAGSDQLVLRFEDGRYAPRVEGLLDNGLPEPHTNQR